MFEVISSFLFSWIILFVVFMAIDLVWLVKIARPLYQHQLGKLLRPQPDITAAAVFYLGYTAFLTLFGVVQPLVSSVWLAALWGGLAGAFAYFTYEFTNKATLKDWPWPIVWIDIAWGTLLSASSAGAAFWVLMMVGV